MPSSPLTPLLPLSSFLLFLLTSFWRSFVFNMSLLLTSLAMEMHLHDKKLQFHVHPLYSDSFHFILTHFPEHICAASIIRGNCTSYHSCFCVCYWCLPNHNTSTSHRMYVPLDNPHDLLLFQREGVPAACMALTKTKFVRDYLKNISFSTIL